MGLSQGSQSKRWGRHSTCPLDLHPSGVRRRGQGQPSRNSWRPARFEPDQGLLRPASWLPARAGGRGMDEEPAMHRTILASVSALLLLGSAALAQSNTATGQGQMITPGQEGGGQSSGTRIGEGATPSAGATGGQMDRAARRAAPRPAVPHQPTARPPARPMPRGPTAAARQATIPAASGSRLTEDSQRPCASPPAGDA